MFNELYFNIKIILKQKDISFLAFIISLFLLPNSINLSTFALVTAVTLKIIQAIFFQNKLLKTKALKYSALLGLLFFIYILLSSIFQTSFKNTIELFNKQYSHFALLFLAPLLFKKRGDNKLLLYSFLLGTITAVVLVFLISMLNGTPFNRVAFLKYLDIHHTYLAIFLLFILNLILNNLFNFKKGLTNSYKAIFLTIAVLIIAVLFQLESKASMIIIIGLIVFYIFQKLNIKRLSLFIISLFAFMFLINAFNNKIHTSYEKALDFRLQLWEESFNIFKESPIIGNLKAPEKDLLNFNHYVNGKYFFLDSDLNSHNQYLSILMRFGALGTMILLLYGVYIIALIMKTKQKYTISEFIGFSLIILFMFYIENVIDRHHGIVYFSVFYNYYLVAFENEKN
ncbi:O-antigen ligase family protein [Yeosuana sp. MJ-SS3]|uniref:O-antigen ligase family protein n=1 Tax=Gilvirhabdus luticola TaxID=3079858 RepID=A0ABU3U2K8_9FLAO|nr:O-antigen ligase family protein [Yeosuana sp. MJ-SS3]MDU8884642.1 O-antigen ligase family protein [Yeosuana sp. MJ-SS3]